MLEVFMSYGNCLFDYTFFNIKSGRFLLKMCVQHQLIRKLHKVICKQFFDAVYTSGITT
ncbi:hypothetical protein SAMN02910265_02250 [Ruminococcus flavefaciens]|uniref:Uncharacterized protein n=1 Tax=Ruminococcus flavefaciens TaxID=1265 RepID=A0A1H6KDT2_RUMFL|nr:hypothetical protein SAMN02910265_02250 [Ruminococcus flavefaciens]